MATSTTDAGERFSLLLLEDGEVLLDDVAADYEFMLDERSGKKECTPPELIVERFLLRTTECRLRGRLKVGSRNLYFDADDWRIPILRIPTSSVTAISTRPVEAEIQRSLAPTTGHEPAHSARVRSLLADANAKGRSEQTTVIVTFGAHGEITRAESGPELGSHDRSAQFSSELPPRSEVTTEDLLEVGSSRVVLQRENGADHPYVDVTLHGYHLIFPVYSDTKRLAELMRWLLRVSSNPSRREREMELRNAIAEREQEPFDIAALSYGVDEIILFDEPGTAVYALAKAPGRVCISSAAIYFMPLHGRSGVGVKCIPVTSLKSVRRLRHGIEDAAVEIGYAAAGSYEHAVDIGFERTLMLALKSRSARESVVENIHRLAASRKLATFERVELEVAVNRWRAGSMSNFDYLLYLNMAAGRSFNDLSQYPVFPWILADYTSDQLDLDVSESFRDLSLPIGALNPSRLDVLKTRFADMPSPRFFYGTHYSTPAYVINYLVRAVPCAMLRLQNGTFDAPDRLFSSIAEAWRGVNSNTTDVKELIPEFFSVVAREVPSGILSSTAAPGEFLDNVLGLDLGTRQDGKRVSDVELPPWAKGSSDLFVRKNREALESEYVSRHFHEWIDLIFGVNARNADACNVFYTDVAAGTARGREDLINLDEDTVAQLDTVFLEFGRTPEQLFHHHHPPRFGTIQDDVVYSAPESVRESSAPISEYSSFELTDVDDDDCAVDGDQGDCNASIQDPDTEDGQGSALWTVKSRSPFGRRRSLSLLSPSSAFMDCLAKDARGLPEVTSMKTPESIVVDGVIISASMTVIASDQLDSKNGVPTPTIVTAWSDGYVRIYADLELRRARYVDDLCALACAKNGVVFLGTGAGTIIAYSIGTGRVETACIAAHDTAIIALRFCNENDVLISSSLDASVKIWTVEGLESHHFPSLRRSHELDAEDAIVSLCADNEGSCLYLAVLTCKETVLAWRINVGDVENLQGRIEFPKPFVELLIVDEEDHVEPTPRTPRSSLKQRICWVDSAPRRRMLATLVKSNLNSDTVRLWYVDSPTMPAAEIVLPSGSALCVAQGGPRGTLFVAGMNGFVGEYDRTGFALCHAVLTRRGSPASEQAVTAMEVFPRWSTVIARIGHGQVVVWRGKSEPSVATALFH